MSAGGFENRFWTSPDGLKLHYRYYPGPAGKLPLLCIPGLTRNARDFEPLAEKLAGKWPMLCVELRGRGESDYAKDPATYMPLTYLADLEALLDQTQIARFVAIGTSLGGVLTMLLAAGGAERIAAAVLNDIGPAIEPEGIERIREYVGQGRAFPTWMHAARALREQSGSLFPDYAISDWIAMAKRLMTVSGNGRIVFDYDMKIAEPFNAPADPAAPAVDMWPAWRALRGRPLLAVRGALSDILSAKTLKKMAKEVEGCEALTLPRIGHTPTLGEPEAAEAIVRLLAKLS
ncbi:MAG: alpha/beta hydrolase [Novosphingobium sp.]|nr:alpha/beta hydrolase [Novosphingobium sp.]MBO9601377.1 alpha/beta hydrolase [Novosphingobium sp.]